MCETHQHRNNCRLNSGCSWLRVLRLALSLLSWLQGKQFLLCSADEGLNDTMTAKILQLIKFCLKESQARTSEHKKSSLEVCHARFNRVLLLDRCLCGLFGLPDSAQMSGLWCQARKQASKKVNMGVMCHPAFSSKITPGCFVNSLMSKYFRYSCCLLAVPNSKIGRHLVKIQNQEDPGALAEIRWVS